MPLFTLLLTLCTLLSDHLRSLDTKNGDYGNATLNLIYLEAVKVKEANYPLPICPKLKVICHLLLLNNLGHIF